MANVLNRTTKQFLQSVNTPEYPIAQWIINPDMSPVAGVPNKYWIITGDIVSEMSAGEKAAVDATALTTQRDEAVARLDNVEDDDRQLLKILIGEFNILRALHGLPDRTLAQLRAAIRNGYGN